MSQARSGAPPAPWGTLPLPKPEKGALSTDIGTSRLWTRTKGRDELRIAVQEGPKAKRASLDEDTLEVPEPPPPPPEDSDLRLAMLTGLSWKRTIFKVLPDNLRLRPMLPDRPIVMASEYPITVWPESRVKVFVSVPTWASLRAPGEEQRDLLEFPTMTLSSTWFGNMSSGELCYFTPTRARVDSSQVVQGPHLVTCPISIRNASQEVLEIRRLCLRVQYFSLFHFEGRLWSDETRVTYQGGGDFSRLQWSGKPPPEAPDALLFTSPRQVSPRGLTAWTFEHFQSGNRGIV